MRKYLLFIALALGVVIFVSSSFSFPRYKDNSHDQNDYPTNVILMIGDGMGISQITAGLIANGGSLNLERCPVVGLTKTFSADDLITDSAAGASAIATGKKTKNEAISVDQDGKPIQTIMEYASTLGMLTGLIATSTIVHATPAAFYAHNPARGKYYEIAADLAFADVDFWIGGGRKFFNKRPDNLNLLDTLSKRGYQVISSLDEISPSFSKHAVLTHEGHPESVIDGRGDYLVKSLEQAIHYFSQSSGGFFIMAEGSQIDWAGHDNENVSQYEEMIDFDNAVGVALDFAEQDKNTLVVVCSDHETGGYAITGGSLADKSVEGKFLTTHHTAALVPVFAFGPGAELFAGIYENTDLFYKLMKLLSAYK